MGKVSFYIGKAAQQFEIRGNPKTRQSSTSVSPLSGLVYLVTSGKFRPKVVLLFVLLLFWLTEHILCEDFEIALVKRNTTKTPEERHQWSNTNGATFTFPSLKTFSLDKTLSLTCPQH